MEARAVGEGGRRRTESCSDSSGRGSTVSAVTLTGVCEIHATLPMSQTQTRKDRVHGDWLVWGSHS